MEIFCQLPWYHQIFQPCGKYDVDIFKVAILDALVTCTVRNDTTKTSKTHNHFISKSSRIVCE